MPCHSSAQNDNYTRVYVEMVWNFTLIVKHINKHILDESMEHARMIMETNYLAGCIFMKEVISAMKSKGIDDGHIININR